MSRRALVWRQIGFALPLEAATATNLLQRLVVDASLGHIVLEARAQGGAARWLMASTSQGPLDAVVCQLAPGSQVTPLRSGHEPADAQEAAASSSSSWTEPPRV